MSLLCTEVIARAQSFPGIKAGIARLVDILKGPSYHVIPDGAWSPGILDNVRPRIVWPPAATSVLVLGLHHPADNPRLDWWDGGNTMGNRLLIEVSIALTQWLEKEHGIRSTPLPYHLDSGGLFLKDAAVLAGLGIIGRNNLLLNPEWGPRLRLRSVLIVEELEPTGPINGVSPCESCDTLCHSICPQNAFSTGAYDRPRCIEQLTADRANKTPDNDFGQDGVPKLVAKNCRACEFVCPAGSFRFAKNHRHPRGLPTCL
jgi:epoxyqueuosine reductase